MFINDIAIIITAIIINEEIILLVKHNIIISIKW